MFSNWFSLLVLVTINACCCFATSAPAPASAPVPDFVASIVTRNWLDSKTNCGTEFANDYSEVRSLAMPKTAADRANLDAILAYSAPGGIDNAWVGLFKGPDNVLRWLDGTAASSETIALVSAGYIASPAPLILCYYAKGNGQAFTGFGVSKCTVRRMSLCGKPI